MTDDLGRNEFDVLLQRTRRISMGSPTYPEAVGIKWAASELGRLEAENAAMKEAVRKVKAVDDVVCQNDDGMIVIPFTTWYDIRCELLTLKEETDRGPDNEK